MLNLSSKLKRFSFMTVFTIDHHIRLTEQLTNDSLSVCNKGGMEGYLRREIWYNSNGGGWTMNVKVYIHREWMDEWFMFCLFYFIQHWITFKHKSFPKSFSGFYLDWWLFCPDLFSFPFVQMYSDRKQKFDTWTNEGRGLRGRRRSITWARMRPRQLTLWSIIVRVL